MFKYDVKDAYNCLTCSAGMLAALLLVCRTKRIFHVKFLHLLVTCHVSSRAPPRVKRLFLWLLMQLESKQVAGGTEEQGGSVALCGVAPTYCKLFL